MNFGNSEFVILLAGICFFLFGMSLTSQSLEKLFSKRITKLLNKTGNNNFLSIIVGVSLTTVLQSSGAVTSMLVNLGSAKVISLPQVMGVIIGTAIGATFTVQLISFNLSQFAFPLMIISFVVYFLAKNPKIQNGAMAFIGFSLLFMGMGLISNAAHFFAELEWFQKYLVTLRENPYLVLVISMSFCAFVHSSTVTVGIAMGLAQSGAITIDEALFWVYGANIGTTSTALFAAMGSNYIGKQVAWAHFFYKTLSVAIFLIPPIHNSLASLMMALQTTPSRAVANGHLLFNLLSAAIFFPFIRPAARWIEKLFPKAANEDFSAEFLRLDNYQSATLAISYATRESLRMADIVLSMIEDSFKIFQDDNPALIASIKDRDNKVDYLYRETKMFLLDHANKSPTAVHQHVMDLIMFISDIERAADAIDINLITLALKKNALKLEFSEAGKLELLEMHTQLLKVARLSIAAFSERKLCEEVVALKRELAKMEISLRESHIGRLNQGMRESINTSSIHLDVLSELKRVGSLMCSHAYK